MVLIGIVYRLEVLSDAVTAQNACNNGSETASDRSDIATSSTRALNGSLLNYKVISASNWLCQRGVCQMLLNAHYGFVRRPMRCQHTVIDWLAMKAVRRRLNSEAKLICRSAR